MTGLGGSRPIQARWNYVQPEEPSDRRDGVRWIDTSGDDHVTRVFTTVYNDWMRETRIWTQNTAPTPRVGPLDGDQWIDTSQDNRPTRIYSSALNDWATATPQQTESFGIEYGYSPFSGSGGQTGQQSGHTKYYVFGFGDTRPINEVVLTSWMCGNSYNYDYAGKIYDYMAVRNGYTGDWTVLVDSSTILDSGSGGSGNDYNGSLNRSYTFEKMDVDAVRVKIQDDNGPEPINRWGAGVDAHQIGLANHSHPI